MALRRQSQTPESPDLQAERLTRDEITSDLSRLHAQIVTAHASKKILTEEFEKEKERIEGDLAAIKRNFVEEASKIDENIEKKRQANTVMNVRNETLRKENDNMIADNKRLTDQKSALSDEISANRSFVDGLKRDQNRIRSEIEQDKKDAIEASESKKTMRSHIDVMVTTKNIKQAELDEIDLKKESAIRQHAEASVGRDSIHADLTESRAALDRVNGELSQAHESLLATKAEELAIKQARDEKEANTTERMRIAAILETKVDNKLKNLKEIEDHFTTEHLARLGYSKLGTQ